MINLSLAGTRKTKSERVTHREVEFAVTLEAGVQQWPVFLPAGGVVGLHAHIDTHKKILEVQADAGAIGGSDLLIELVELENAARLVLIVLDGPDVARVQEEAQLHYPEQLGTVLEIDIEADITALVDEVGQ